MVRRKKMKNIKRFIFVMGLALASCASPVFAQFSNPGIPAQATAGTGLTQSGATINIAAPIPFNLGGTAATTATGATANLQSLATGAGATARSVQAKLSDYLNISDYSTAAQATVAGFGNHLLVPIGTTLTINVPSQVATISQALTDIQNWDIYGNVVIQVADGAYTVPSGILLANKFGNNVSLIGDVANPANCVLNFTTAGGFYLPWGDTWGVLNGFSIQNTSGTKQGLGILTDGGVYSQVGPNIIVNGFYYGIAARNGGRINATGTSASNAVVVTNAGDVGIWAFLHSYVSAEYAQVSGGADTANNLGAGFAAEMDSNIDATGSSSTGNYLSGYSAISGSSIRAWNTTASGNGGAVSSPPSAGYIVASMGAMEIFGGTTENNIGYGYATDGTTQISGNYALAVNTGNSLGTAYIPWQIKSDTTTAINSGSLTINASGPNATGGAAYFDQNISASNFIIHRFLTSGTEVWREQYSNAGGAYTWGNGTITGLTYTPATGAFKFDGETQVGAIGDLKEFEVGMSNSFARLRERDTNDHISLTSNINTSNVQDDAAYPSWEMAFGGNDDTFRVRRSPPGSGTLANLVTVSNTGQLNAVGGIQSNGVAINTVLSGSVASIGGSALSAGQCTSGSVAVTGATNLMGVTVTPETYPGDGIYWNGYVSSAGTVTVKVCASIATTPAASLYNVRILQ